MPPLPPGPSGNPARQSPTIRGGYNGSGGSKSSKSSRKSSRKTGRK